MTTGPTDPHQPEQSPPTPYSQPYSSPPQPYGQPPYAYGVPGYVVAPPNEGLSLAAMIVGILSLVLACGYGIGLLGAPVALVMGRISMNRIARSEGQLGGRGFAVAGFVMGIIGTIFLVLAIIAVVVFVVLASNGTFDEGPQNNF